MKIKAIGKYGRYAPKNEATNCYLIETDNGKNILIDLGSGALSKLQNHIEISSIDIVIITHLHFDHCSDLGTLAYALGYHNLKKIDVYMPGHPEGMKSVFDAKNFETHYIDNDTLFCVDNVQFSFAESPHPVETYSVIIDYYGKKIVYTSDCSKDEIIKKNTIGADIVIGDACILQKDYTSTCPHISVKSLAQNVPASCKLFLAHLTAFEEEEILQEGQKYHKDTKLIEDFEI